MLMLHIEDAHAAYARGDYAQAMKWYSLAADQGLARADEVIE